MLHSSLVNHSFNILPKQLLIGGRHEKLRIDLTAFRIFLLFDDYPFLIKK